MKSDKGNPIWLTQLIKELRREGLVQQILYKPADKPTNKKATISGFTKVCDKIKETNIRHKRIKGEG